MVWCDTCVSSFCVECIKRNFGGPEGLAAITAQDKWSCFLCVPSSVDPIRAKYAAEASDANKPRKRSRDALSSLAPSVDEASAKEATKEASSPNWGLSTTTENKKSDASYGANGWVVSEDLSLGRERNIALRCVNEVDNEEPPPFVYTAANIDSSSVREALKASRGDPDFLACCNCVDGCADASKCACQRLSSSGQGGRATYAHGTRRLLEQRAAVYECNPACQCHSLCHNRVVCSV